MIKLVLCLRRKHNIDELTFRHYWDNEFERFIRQVGSELQSKRIAKSLTLQIDANALMQQRQQSLKAFDAMVEFWFDEPEKGFAHTHSEHWKQQVDDSLRNEHSMIDMSNSALFYVEEKITIGEK